MTPYTPPVRDIAYLLHDVLRVEGRSDISAYEELTPDLTGQILESAGKLAAEVLAPINRTGDQVGCRIVADQGVQTPPGFREAYQALIDGGWPSLECDLEYGGQGLPTVINLAVAEIQSAANMALMMYQGLTHGAYSALHKHGTEAQKRAYLPKLASGEWAGAMSLTEPQCGTDLGLIRTKAEPREDGAYHLHGSKIFITAGDHDLTENVVHLVLARLPDAPEGVKGISLFVTSKHLVGPGGSIGERNAFHCARLENKMGIHGSATCEIIYDGAVAELVGEPHKGLRAMFTMMNEARILVAMQGVGAMSAAYQCAAAYAKDRLQGRAATGPAAPEKPADPIIAHPDIRRSLMTQRAFLEGGRAFLLWGGALIDGELRGADDATRARDADLVALLTPVLKGFLTDKGFEQASEALQVLGGHGYTEDWPLSQVVRDARIAMIYEGANGVQALDLVGRKLPREGGKAFMAFLAETSQAAAALAAAPAPAAALAEPMRSAIGDLQASAEHFMRHGLTNPDEALAGATDFLALMGLVAVGHMWGAMAKTSAAALESGAEDPDFHRAKLATARFYMTKLLPETALRRARIEAGAEPVMALPAEAF